jgi:hypothetical protein
MGEKRRLKRARQKTNAYAPRKADQKAKRKDHEHKEDANLRRPLMDIAAYWVLGISVIPFALFGVFYAAHKIPAIILFGVGVTCVTVAACLYWINAVTPPQPKLEAPTFTEDVKVAICNIGPLPFQIDLRSTSRQAPFRFQASDFVPFWLYVENGRLFADITMLGQDGTTVVQMEHNQFKVNVPAWDANSNASAFEVVDEHQTPVFQIIYKRPAHILVNGVFHEPAGQTAYAQNDSLTFAPPGQPPPPWFHLNPIFKYPSWKHPGEYEPDMEQK